MVSRISQWPTIPKASSKVKCYGSGSQWVNSKPNEVAERERAYTKIQILADFVNEVKTVMETGMMAEHEKAKEELGTHY